VRTLLSAAVCLLLSFGVLPGPVSAAGNNDRIFAQATPQTNGTINGTIRDQQGHPVSGASVSVEGAGRSASATSTDAGTFSVAVPPGLYTIAVSHGGYQSASAEDVAVAAGATVSVGISLAVANLQNLRIIGRTSVSAGNRFNPTESSIALLPPTEIAIRQTNNLTDVVTELPGVTVSRGFSSTPNTWFSVRGEPFQTRVNIDGHPVSSGIAGKYNTNYQEAGMFGNIQVLKGAGALEYGLASPAGIINYVLKRATKTPVDTVSLSTNEFGQAIGAVDLGRRFGSADEFGVRLNLAGGDTGSFTHDAGGTRWLGALTTDWATKGTRIRLDYEQFGVNIVRRACEEPLRQIAKNAGEEGSVIVEKIRNNKESNYGYNAQSGAFEDLVKAGVIDPTKVTRTALQNAASIAGLMLTTDALVADIPEPKQAPQGGGHGGGMGDMY